MTDSEAPPNAPAREPPRFEVRCAESTCPGGVGLLVFDGSGSPERCTAALVEPSAVMTASHCIPEAMRRQGSACDGLWVALSVGEAASEWIECARVEGARDLPHLTPLQQDLAVLRLQRSASAPPLEVDASEIQAGSIVTVVSVDPHPIYATQHSLRAHLCRVTGADEVAEALENEAARRVGWLTSCMIIPGNSGSAVLDYDGRLRAIVHGGSGPTHEVGVTSTPRL